MDCGLIGKDRAYWLADKIGAHGDYAKEAALALCRQADEIERLNHALVEAVDVCMRKANIRPRPGLSERTASYCNQRAAECADAIRALKEQG